MSRLLCFLVLVLLVLHQDNWFWTDGRLVFGFIPIGLFYHASLSVAAALVWWWATRFCWPAEVGETACETASEGAGR
ncbi:MAG: DUF3311 domain-containing protein [Planctomycetes bacterium]|nr:DUF3311 domain-containing protein [Planctomycetota bacterium]